MKYIYNIIIIISIIVIALSLSKKKKYKGLEYTNLKAKNFRKIIANNKNYQKISIPIDLDLNKIILPNQLIDTSFYLKLETNENCYIGNIDEIKIYDNKIFILDIYKSKSIFIFDKKGRFLKKIGESGKKEGQYLRPQTFDIDIENNEVLVFNPNKRNILRYDFNGVYLGEIKLNFGIESFKIMKNNTYFSLSGNYTNDHLAEIKNKVFYVFDNKGNILSYGPDKDKYFNNITYGEGNNLISKNKIISFSEKFSNTIYEVKTDTLKKLYNLILTNELEFIKSLNKKNDKEFFTITNKINNELPYFLGKHFITEKHLVFNYIYKNRNILCFYNRITKKIETGSIINQTDSKYPLFINFCGTHEEYFISYVNSYEYLEFIKKTKINNKENLEVIRKSDNPLLFFYNLKNF